MSLRKRRWYCILRPKRLRAHKRSNRPDWITQLSSNRLRVIIALWLMIDARIERLLRKILP